MEATSADPNLVTASCVCSPVQVDKPSPRPADIKRATETNRTSIGFASALSCPPTNPYPRADTRTHPIMLALPGRAATALLEVEPCTQAGAQ
jgi:hypothetical protein